MEYEISVEDFRALREQQPVDSSRKLCLLDIRETWESETASLPDSLVITMSDLPSRAHAELDPEAHIVVYCHNGRRSLIIAKWLREEGFPHTQSLAGGIEVWSQIIDPSLPRY